MEAVSRRDGLGVPFLVGGAGQDLPLPIEVLAKFLGVGLSQHRVVARRGGRRIHEDQPRHTRRMAQRVLEGEDRPPRVPEHRRLFQVKAIPHPIDVLDVRRERDLLGSNAIRRLPAPALVVVDEVVRVGQPIEVGQQIADVEVRSAVEHDRRASRFRRLGRRATRCRREYGSRAAWGLCRDWSAVAGSGNAASRTHAARPTRKTVLMTRSLRFAWVQEAPRRAGRAISPSSDPPNIRRAGREVNDPREYIEFAPALRRRPDWSCRSRPPPPWPAETRMTSPLPPNALRFRTSSRARSRLRWVALGLAAALIFDVLVAPWLASSATDWLWFREIHFESVFVTSLVAHTVLFVVGALVAYGFIFANLSVARRGIVGVPTPFLNRNGEAIDLTRFVPRVLHLGALFVAFVAGVVASAQWMTVLTALHGSAVGATDPLFGRDIGFYLFRLPAISAGVEHVRRAHDAVARRRRTALSRRRCRLVWPAPGVDRVGSIAPRRGACRAAVPHLRRAALDRRFIGAAAFDHRPAGRRELRGRSRAAAGHSYLGHRGGARGRSRGLRRDSGQAPLVRRAGDRRLRRDRRRVARAPARGRAEVRRRAERAGARAPVPRAAHRGDAARLAPRQRRRRATSGRATSSSRWPTCAPTRRRSTTCGSGSGIS